MQLRGSANKPDGLPGMLSRTLRFLRHKEAGEDVSRTSQGYEVVIQHRTESQSARIPAATRGGNFRTSLLDRPAHQPRSTGSSRMGQPTLTSKSSLAKPTLVTYPLEAISSVVYFTTSTTTTTTQEVPIIAYLPHKGARDNQHDGS